MAPFMGPSMVFAFFALMCAIALVYVFAVVPETKGLTLEQIDELMRSAGGWGSICGFGSRKDGEAKLYAPS